MAPATTLPSGYMAMAWWRVKKESGVTSSLHFLRRVRRVHAGCSTAKARPSRSWLE